MVWADTQFDKMMNKTCSIKKKDPAAPKDAYNQPGNVLVSAEDNVPCRLSTLSGGRENKDDRNYTLSRAKVFMRLRAFPVTEHMQLIIDSVAYDITNVQNPGGLDHHLEIIVQEIKA